MNDECEHCEGRGWIVEPDGGAGTARRCVCQRSTVEDRLRAAGVPEEFIHPTPWRGRRPDTSAFPKRAHMLTLCGPAGRGKSRVAADLVRDWLAGGGRARWVESETLLRSLKARFGLEPGPETLLEPLLNPRLLLVLDELGAERGTEWEAGELSHLIRRRYRDQSPTIVTTNHTEQDIEEMEPRLHSRMWGSAVVPFGGPDFRRLASTSGPVSVAVGGSR